MEGEKEGGRGMEGLRVGRRWENGERKFTSGREKLKSGSDNGEKLVITASQPWLGYE